MKYLIFLSLLIHFAACKKDDCEPEAISTPPAYQPTKDDSIQGIWKLDTLYRSQNNNPPTASIYPNNYLTFSEGTCLYTQIPGISLSPYSISSDTIYVDYSIASVPTSYYKIESISDNKLVISHVSPISTSVFLRYIYLKQ